MTHGRTGKLVIRGIILGLIILSVLFLFQHLRLRMNNSAITVALTEAAMLKDGIFIPNPPALEPPNYPAYLEERLSQNKQELEELTASSSYSGDGVTVIHGSTGWADSMLENDRLQAYYQQYDPKWQVYIRMLGLRDRARKEAFNLICQTYEQYHKIFVLPPYLERFRHTEPNPAYKDLLSENKRCPWTSTIFEQPTFYYSSGIEDLPLSDKDYSESTSRITCDNYGCRKIADFALERMLRDLKIFNSRGQIAAPAAPSPPSFLDLELEAIKSQSFTYQAEKPQRELQEQQRIQKLHDERTATLQIIRERLCTKYENNRTEERLPTYLLAYKNLDTSQYASDCSWSDAVIAELKRLIPTP